MTFEKLSKSVHNCIRELQEDHLKDYSSTLVIDDETWTVKFKRTKPHDKK